MFLVLVYWVFGYLLLTLVNITIIVVDIVAIVNIATWIYLVVRDLFRFVVTMSITKIILVSWSCLIDIISNICISIISYIIIFNIRLNKFYRSCVVGTSRYIRSVLTYVVPYHFLGGYWFSQIVLIINDRIVFRSLILNIN